MDYATIRDADLLGPIVGDRVVGVTQHDEIEWLCGGPAYFCIHFACGLMLRVVIDDNSDITIGAP